MYRDVAHVIKMPERRSLSTLQTPLHFRMRAGRQAACKVFHLTISSTNHPALNEVIYLKHLPTKMPKHITEKNDNHDIEHTRDGDAHLYG